MVVEWVEGEGCVGGGCGEGSEGWDCVSGLLLFVFFRDCFRFLFALFVLFAPANWHFLCIVRKMDASSGLVPTASMSQNG